MVSKATTSSPNASVEPFIPECLYLAVIPECLYRAVIPEYLYRAVIPECLYRAVIPECLYRGPIAAWIPDTILRSDRLLMRLPYPTDRNSGVAARFPLHCLHSMTREQSSARKQGRGS